MWSPYTRTSQKREKMGKCGLLFEFKTDKILIFPDIDYMEINRILKLLDRIIRRFSFVTPCVFTVCVRNQY